MTITNNIALTPAEDAEIQDYPDAALGRIYRRQTQAPRLAPPAAITVYAVCYIPRTPGPGSYAVSIHCRDESHTYSQFSRMTERVDLEFDSFSMAMAQADGMPGLLEICTPRTIFTDLVLPESEEKFRQGHQAAPDWVHLLLGELTTKIALRLPDRVRITDVVTAGLRECRAQAYLSFKTEGAQANRRSRTWSRTPHKRPGRA
jgi:hypothetical protein